MKNYCFELSLRYKTSRRKAPSSEEIITNPASAKKFVSRLYSREVVEHHEEFYLIALSRSNTPIGYTKLSVGGTSASIVDIRIAMQYLILSNASGFIMAHNHPSCNLKPSNEDIHITKKLSEAAKMFDITLYDHFIITRFDVFSFCENGLL